MSDPIDIPNSKSTPAGLDAAGSVSTNGSPPTDYLSSGYAYGSRSFPYTPGTPGTPALTPGLLSRSGSQTNMSDLDGDAFPPLDRLTMFDVLENLALPQHFERIQSSIAAQTEKVRRQQQKLRSSGISAKDKVVDEWRRRIPTPDEQLDKYRKRMRDNVDKLSKRWSDARVVTVREKVSFIGGVLNIFLSGYFIGAMPEYFHYWYTAQLCYFMPIRWYTYHKIGYHYFLADLCYFVNLLMVLSIWFFPGSKRLFISTFCLAFGNNAVAIAMWRNSLVFHSLDKVTSLFIHIMPCVTLHCLIHLIPKEMQLEKFPAIHDIRFSLPGTPEHYSLGQMIIWATVPYAVWQLSYHFMITIRRREKIAAGRPTSFTWLRKSYAKNFLGRLVLSLPDILQEPAFMGIQYAYALLTMLPCPLWFWYRWASSAFLMAVFTWATYNGATYYIDVFGKRMEKELLALKKEVQRWQGTPEGKTIVDDGKSPVMNSVLDGDKLSHKRSTSVDNIPLLDEKKEGSTAIEDGMEQNAEGIRKRD